MNIPPNLRRTVTSDKKDQVPHLAPRAPRRGASLAILAALVGATAVLAGSTPTASATYGRCDPRRLLPLLRHRAGGGDLPEPAI
jgi:hypothetical protein